MREDTLYVLHIWRDGSGQGTVWRAKLEKVDDRETRHFHSLEQLAAFLREGAARTREDGR